MSKGKVDLRLAPVLGTNAKDQPRFQWKIVRRLGDRVDEILRDRKSEGARALRDAIEDALKAGHTVHAMFVDQTGGGVEGDYALDGTMTRRAISPKEGLLGPRCFEIPITSVEAQKRRAAARPPKKAVSGKRTSNDKKRLAALKRLAKANGISAAKVTAALKKHAGDITKAYEELDLVGMGPAKPKTPSAKPAKKPSGKKPTPAKKPSAAKKPSGKPAKALPEMMVAYYKATGDGLDQAKAEKWVAAHAKLRGPVSMWLKKHGGTAQQRKVFADARNAVARAGNKKPTPAKPASPKKPTPGKKPSGKKPTPARTTGKKPTPAKPASPKKPTPAKKPSGARLADQLPPAIAAFASAAAGKVGEAVQYLTAVGPKKRAGLKLGFSKAKGVSAELRELFKKALDKVEEKVVTSPKQASAKKPTPRPPKTATRPPKARTPKASTPKAPTPKAATPKARTPKVSTPKPKTPSKPKPEASEPKASTGGEAAFAAQLAQLFG